MPEKFLVPNPRRKFYYPDGITPLAGGKVFTYEAGSTTKATTYTDHTGLTPNTNPIILDSEGECDIWLDPTVPISTLPLPTGPIGPQGPPGIPGPPGPTGNTAEFSNTVDIDSATIYDGLYDRIGAAPLYVPILPAQGANVLVVPVMIVPNYHYRAVPYATNAGNFVVSWGPPILPIAVSNFTLPNIMLEGTDDMALIMPGSTGLNGIPLTAYGAIGAADKPLTISFDQPVDGPAILTAILAVGGAGYAAGNTGTINGGDGNATYTVNTVVAGVVSAVTLTFGGTGYTTTPGAATTATTGVGTGLTLNIFSARDVSGTLRITTFYRKLLLLTP